MANYRIESDLLGPREVPAEALYGVQTLRGMENFHISGAKLSDYPSFIKGLAITKKAAANKKEKVGMVTKEQCDAIVKACDDYRAALRGLRRNPSDRNYMDEALQLERFFHSAWYQELTTVDGDFLIRKIREEIKNGR